MEDLKTYKLGDLVSIQSGGTPNKAIASYWGGNIPWISAKTMYVDFITDSDLYITEEGLKNGSKLAPVGSILLLTRGGGLFNRIPVCMVNNEVAYNQDIKCITVKENSFTSNLFIFYWLYSHKELLSGILETTGIGAGKIDTSRLLDIDVHLPDLETQHRYIQICSSILEKIEVNKRINDNLEQQIQTLYRERFIDNPKTEWATIALSEVATFVGGYSYKGNELVDSSETAMATIKNFERNGGFKLDGYKPVSPSSKLKEEQHAELFDILIAHTDLTQNAEVIGNAEIILSKDSYSDVIFSMDLVKVVAKESFPYQFLLALLLKNSVFKSHCIGYVNGTTVLHMNKRALPDFNTQIPTCEDAARMNEIATSIFTKMSENLSEIANLTKLPDSLLPKLMSGELKINEIDC